MVVIFCKGFTLVGDFYIATPETFAIFVKKQNSFVAIRKRRNLYEH